MTHGARAKQSHVKRTSWRHRRKRRDEDDDDDMNRASRWKRTRQEGFGPKGTCGCKLQPPSYKTTEFCRIISPGLRGGSLVDRGGQDVRWHNPGHLQLFWKIQECYPFRRANAKTKAVIHAPRAQSIDMNASLPLAKRNFSTDVVHGAQVWLQRIGFSHTPNTYASLLRQNNSAENLVKIAELNLHVKPG